MGIFSKRSGVILVNYVNLPNQKFSSKSLTKT